MRRIQTFTAITLALGVALPAQATKPDPVAPSWMAGCWISETEGRWVEECWTTPRGGKMMGSGRTGKGDTVEAWEFMRIELAGGTDEDRAIRMAFHASPNGSPWTRFGWVPDAGPGYVFVNAANDYPQRVRYWREDQHMLAEISLLDGSKAQRWTFRRMGN